MLQGINDTLVSARVREWDLAQGGDGIKSGHLILFSNGARRDINPLGPLIDPPEPRQVRCKRTREWITDNEPLVERYKLIVKYWEVRTEKATDKFEELRDRLRQQAEHSASGKPIAPPSADEIAELRKLQKLVRTERKSLTKARKDLEDAKPKPRFSLPANYDSGQQARDVLKEIDAIKV